MNPVITHFVNSVVQCSWPMMTELIVANVLTTDCSAILRPSFVISGLFVLLIT